MRALLSLPCCKSDSGVFLTACCSYDDIVATEHELVAATNARAIAAVQREAQRIAQKLDRDLQSQQLGAIAKRDQADQVSMLAHCVAPAFVRKIFAVLELAGSILQALPMSCSGYKAWITSPDNCRCVFNGLHLITLG